MEVYHGRYPKSGISYWKQTIPIIYERLKAPDGYKLPDGDIAFTVSHYGEDVQAPIYNEKDRRILRKTDYAGTEIAGADCELSILKKRKLGSR